VPFIKISNIEPEKAATVAPPCDSK